jgi:hypothetical protein
VDIVFLDANVLFSAAYRAGTGLCRLWELTDVQIVSSEYACTEARVNLAQEAQERDEKIARLDELLRSVRVVSEPLSGWFPEGVRLPEKDRPILLAALGAGATHLLTGDVKHFGPYFGQRVEAVLIMRPADYLRARAPSPPDAPPANPDS